MAGGLGMWFVSIASLFSEIAVAACHGEKRWRRVRQVRFSFNFRSDETNCAHLYAVDRTVVEDVKGEKQREQHHREEQCRQLRPRYAYNEGAIRVRRIWPEGPHSRFG